MFQYFRCIGSNKTFNITHSFYSPKCGYQKAQIPYVADIISLLDSTILDEVHIPQNTISLQLRALTPVRLSRSQFILSVIGGSQGLYACYKAKRFSAAWSFLLKPQLAHDFAQLHVNVRLSGARGSFTIKCGLATAPPLLSGLDISFCSGPFSVHSAAPSGHPHPM